MNRWTKLIAGLLLVVSNVGNAKPVQCFNDVTVAYAFLLANSKNNAQKVNINTASANELIQLVGVGHQSAQAIVDYRKQHGAFGSVDELTKVKGIGQVVLDKNRHLLVVADAK